MGILNTITTERLTALSDKQIAHVATGLGLVVSTKREDTINAIIAHQEGRCPDCDKKKLMPNPKETDLNPK